VIFQEGEGRVYVDGSAFSPIWPEIASAGSAAVQVTNRGLGKTITVMSLSGPGPQTAAAAKRIVFPLGQPGSFGQREVVTDFKGVSTGVAKPRRMMRPRLVRAGLCKQVLTNATTKTDAVSPGSVT